MSIMKTAIFSGILALALLSAAHAAAENPAQNAAPFVANFSYTPHTKKAPASAGVVFAIAVPDLLSDSRSPWPIAPQFAKLSDAFGEDLSRILLAKGFTIRGPFTSYNSITYSDKKAIDVYLIPSIEIRTTAPEEVYRMDDIKVVVAGNITIRLKEIATGELLWTKSIPIESFEISGASGFKAIQWKNLADPRDVSNNRVKKSIEYIELGARNFDDLARGIEERYPALMSAIDVSFDPVEMNALKRQARELKRKKGY